MIACDFSWVGVPGRKNTVIPHTLALIRLVVDAESEDWRGLMYLKRAVFDAYIQARYVWEVEVCEAEAWLSLNTAGAAGSAAAIQGATAALHRTNDTNDTTASLCVFITFSSRFHHAFITFDLAGARRSSSSPRG